MQAFSVGQVFDTVRRIGCSVRSRVVRWRGKGGGLTQEVFCILDKAGCDQYDHDADGEGGNDGHRLQIAHGAF